MAVSNKAVETEASMRPRFCFWKILSKGYRKECDKTLYPMYPIIEDRDLRPFFCPNCGGEIVVKV